jgi:uncharacterized protein (DUF736 family)
MAVAGRNRLRLIIPCRNGSLFRFLPLREPCGLAHSSRTNKPFASPSSALLRPFQGAAGRCPCLPPAIETAIGAGSRSRRSIMANIGTFKKVGNDYQGEILTMSVQTKNVRIIPEDTMANENAPSHRVFVGRAEIGAAWAKRSSEGRDYLSVKLDDPSFTAPIFANLFDDEDGSYNLIWSRARKSNAD